MKIETYGVGITTLEEVFLKIGEDETDEDVVNRQSRKSIKDQHKLRESRLNEDTLE